ncbi:MAG: hypothetical protein WCL57_15110 [Chloroflexota bacterium]|nr:hypothetical protein [Chloroflexota bacterium]
MLDGEYGHNAAMQMALQLNYAALPQSGLKSITLGEDGKELKTYQFTVLHRKFSQPLNVMILLTIAP